MSYDSWLSAPYEDHYNASDDASYEIDHADEGSEMTVMPDEPMDEQGLKCAEEGVCGAMHPDTSHREIAENAVQEYLNEMARLGFTMQPTPEEIEDA